MLVVKLNGAGNGLPQSEAARLCLVTTELLPLVLGHVLGHQRVRGLDHGELDGFILPEIDYIQADVLYH